VADPEFIILGDALWLDFINTAASPASGELLRDRAAYHRWTKALKLAPDVDHVALGDVLKLRERLLGLARALDAGRQPPSSAIRAVNDILANTEGHQQLIRVNGAWRVQFRILRPPDARDAIAASAAQTLADPTLQVRRCGNPDCQLFFADNGRPHDRRWCSFTRCGQKLRVERRRGSRIMPAV